MDINDYLTRLAKKLSIQNSEQKKIDKSIDFLKQKIWGVFQNRLEDVSIFGSYDRGTMLPQTIDNNTDIDILVVFKKDEFQPQTYLNQLRAFSEKNYPKSSVFPNHPSIVIELNHIRFEIVPAVKDRNAWSNTALLIPAPPSENFSWLQTNPTKFKKKLIDKNEQEKQLFIPLLKLIKYWNTQQGTPFSSYELESFAIDLHYPRKNLKDMFFELINDLSGARIEGKQRNAVDKLYERRRRLIVLEKENMPEYIKFEIEFIIQDIL